MLKERKRKGFVLEQIVLGKIQGGLFLYIVLNFSYKFYSPPFQCFFSLFISSSLLIPTSHVYIKGLLLILVPFAPSISLHVVAIRLKYTVQVSPLHQCSQRVSCSAFNMEVATFPRDTIRSRSVLFTCSTYLLI